MYIFTCKFLWVRLKVLRVENVFDEEVAFFSPGRQTCRLNLKERKGKILVVAKGKNGALFVYADGVERFKTYRDGLLASQYSKKRTFCLFFSLCGTVAQMRL